MAYVNIPDSKLALGVAKIVGKLQGQLANQVVKSQLDLTQQFRREGCPTNGPTGRARNKQARLSSNVSNINRRLEKFRRLANKLKAPVKGLKAALKLIILLPIPQSVPPGFGIPVGITTKFADIMHLLKEFIKQISDDIDAITAILETPNNLTSSLSRQLANLDGAIRSCELENELRNQLENGEVDRQQLIDIGLLNDSDEDGDIEEVFITSKLLPSFVGGNNVGQDGNLTADQTTATNDSDPAYKGKWKKGIRYYVKDKVYFNGKIWVCTSEHISDEKGGRLNGPPGIGPWRESNIVLAGGEYGQVDKDFLANGSYEDAIKTLENILLRLETSNINDKVKDNVKGLLGAFNTLYKPLAGSLANTDKDGSIFYTAPNGEVYKLKVVDDLKSPKIAPRRFAVAEDLEGVVVLQGPKSFSSSTDILIEELKFRLDNQLP